MYCYPKLDVAEKYTLKLINTIKEETNEIVFVGIAKMNEWETFEEWKIRAFKNLKTGKNNYNATTTKTRKTTERELKINNNKSVTFFSDIGVNYVNPKKNEQDEKQQKKETEDLDGVVNNTIGNQQEFQAKMKEIANNNDYGWIAAIMSIDDYDSFVFGNNNNNNKEAVTKEVNKMECEMYYLFDIYGNINGVNNKNELKYFGYKLDRRSEYGLILYNGKDKSKCYVPSNEILETLKKEISVKCSFTVCIGSSGLIEDDLGMADDWIERINDNLTQAKKNGANEICFGVGMNSVKYSLESKVDEVTIDDRIKIKSSKHIDVCMNLFVGFFHYLCARFSLCRIVCFPLFLFIFFFC